MLRWSVAIKLNGVIEEAGKALLELAGNKHMRHHPRIQFQCALERICYYSAGISKYLKQMKRDNRKRERRHARFKRRSNH